MARPTSALLLVVLAGCGTSAPPEAFHGTWTVTSVIAPGAAAGPGRGLAAGAEARFEPGAARVKDQACDEPTYTKRSLWAPTFTEAYRVSPQELSITAEPIALVDVTCGSGNLEAGSTLILRPDGSMLTMWDGVFYELRKQQ